MLPLGHMSQCVPYVGLHAAFYCGEANCCRCTGMWGWLPAWLAVWPRACNVVGMLVVRLDLLCVCLAVRPGATQLLWAPWCSRQAPGMGGCVEQQSATPVGMVVGRTGPLSVADCEAWWSMISMGVLLGGIGPWLIWL